MNIKLNDQNLDFQLESEKTMGDVLGGIEEKCQAEKMTVIEVKVDGKLLYPKDLDSFFQEPVENDFKIELFTMSGNDVKNMLKKIGENFVSLAENLESIPVKMQSGEDDSALKILEDFSLNLQDLYTMVKFFDLAEIDTKHKFGDKDLSEYQEEISELLETLIKAFENKDTIEISDISEYELSPLAKTLGNSLLSLQ